MNQHPYVHLVSKALEESKKLKPVRGNVVVGFFAGFLFGPLGAAIYLRSFSDFVMLAGLMLAGSVMTVGIATPVFWTLSGVWVVIRLRNSDQSRAESATL